MDKNKDTKKQKDDKNVKENDNTVKKSWADYKEDEPLDFPKFLFQNDKKINKKINKKTK